MLTIEIAMRFIEKKVSFWRLLNNKVKDSSWNALAGKKDSKPNLIWKADSTSIYIHDPKCANYLTMKSIKELEQGKVDLEVPNRAGAGENIKINRAYLTKDKI